MAGSKGGWKSPVVMAPAQWIARAFPQAELQVLRDGHKIPDHPMVQLARRPNSLYSGLALWTATCISYVLSGNSYWIIVRDKFQRPAELWYVPEWSISPVASRESGITDHYDYSPMGQTIRLDLSDVVHFRYGIDPRNLMLGLSPLASLWREIYTDDKAANFTASLLRNMGLAGVVISPAKGLSVGDQDLEATREYISKRFTGDHIGEPMVLSGETEIKQMAFSPQQLSLGEIRDVPEERVCAVLGIPAAVVGFGTGMQQTKVGATMRELIRLAWTGNLIPMGAVFAAELERSLLPEFETRPEQFRVRFSTENIPELHETPAERDKRVADLFKSSLITRGEAREIAGYEPDPVRDDIFLASTLAVEEPANSQAPAGGKSRKEEPHLHPAETPPRRRMNRRQSDFLRAMDRAIPELQSKMEQDLGRFFRRMGRRAAAIAAETLKERKDTSDDAAMIYGNMDVPALQQDFRKIGEEHALRVARKVFGEMNTAIGLSIGLPDNVARDIIAEGGRHLGLVDLSGQLKQSIYKAVAYARGEGLGVPEIVERIKYFVPAGRWTSPEIRARVIARTETKHAQRVSTLHGIRESGVSERVIVVDNRLGYDDEDCTYWDGREVSLSEAEALIEEEHPNGTRDFVPVIA